MRHGPSRSYANIKQSRRADFRSYNPKLVLRREAASARGRGFMSYGRARTRLRQVIAGVIARGGVIEASLVVQVFGITLGFEVLARSDKNGGRLGTSR